MIVSKIKNVFLNMLVFRCLFIVKVIWKVIYYILNSSSEKYPSNANVCACFFICHPILVTRIEINSLSYISKLAVGAHSFYEGSADLLLITYTKNALLCSS